MSDVGKVVDVIFIVAGKSSELSELFDVLRVWYRFYCI